ncbi:hypothetical protein CN353_31555 [Bacillus cereus]|uniref:O-antigen ligase family protein n=1 Tax=Bacillus cereus TaxID=1396 RepID=UPI000BF66719|nr:O-antigen ligase family protein [Bacillus cereus]PEY80509.1 hypothetical protein CN353_31555 [Bacillus cereus]PGV99666.1 hypothetical protein COD80_02630 [Bacillus cereus]PGY26994.1 hypothetical protein COE27_23260 [Bacillus cereus]
MNIVSFKMALTIILVAGIFGAIYPIAYSLIILPVLSIIFSLCSIKKVCYYLWILLIITVFLGPYVSIPGYENYYLFRILLPIHFVLFIVSNFNKSSINFIQGYKLYYVLVILWISSAILSLLMTNNLSLGMRYLNYMFEICYLFLLCTFYIDGEKVYRDIGRVILWMFHLAIFIGIIEVLTGWHMRLSSAHVYITTTIANQPTGFLYNPNDYALLLCILFPIVIAYIDNYCVSIMKWIWQIVIMISVIFLVISTYSRIGMLCLILIIFILIFYRFKKNSVYIIGILMPIVYFYFTYTVSGSELFKKLYASFVDKGTSTAVRGELYKALWQIVMDSNFLGVGAGNVPVELNKYMLGYTKVGEVGYTTGHNFWLESMGNIGIVGFFVIVSIMIIYFYQSIILITLKKDKSIIFLIPLLIGIAFMGTSIALSTILEKRFLWLILWIGICISRKILVSSKVRIELEDT